MSAERDEPRAAAEAREVQWVVVRFGALNEDGPYRMGAGWCELSHCPMGVTGHPDRESAERAAERLPAWTQPHVFGLEFGG